MSSVAVYYNKTCAACSKVEAKMVQVGAIYMCESCFQTHFDTNDPVNLEKETYLKFLSAQNEQKSNITNENIECPSKLSKAVSNG